jgi:hypothetical protein
MELLVGIGLGLLAACLLGGEVVRCLDARDRGARR